MKKCPKCRFEVINKAEFCSNCGYSFKKAKEVKIWWGIILFLFFILLFLFAIFINIRYEQKNMLPLSIEMKFSDTPATIDVSYNKSDKIIDIDINAQEKIEQWQIATIPKKDLKTELILGSNDNQRSYPSDKLELKVGENLNLHYSIKDSRLKNFIEIKELVNNEEVQISYPNALEFDSSKRKQLKQEYIAAQERERIRKQQAAQQAELRRQYMNMLFNPYYGGYYY